MDNVATLIREGKLDQVDSQLKQRQGESSSSAKWNYERGLLLEARGDIAEAIDAFQAAVDIDAAHTEAAFRLAYNLDLQGEEEEAMELYEGLTDRSPTFVNALINLAVLYEDVGRYDDAHHCIERVLIEHPNHARARLFRKDIESSMSMNYDENYERNLQKRSALMDTPVSDFELSVRSRNCLKKMNIHTLGDLLRISEPELLGYKNFGETSLSEIKAMLKQRSLRLGQLRDEEPSPPSAPSPAAPRRNEHGIAPDIFHKPLSEIEFSGRSRKCLQRLNLNSVGELMLKTEQELLATKNFGQTSLLEIKQRLDELGVALRAS
jgi:DNA-directed RNA polymerase subunit alpha